MLRFRLSRFGWMLVLALGLWTLVVQAHENSYGHEYRYRYVPLPVTELDLPPGLILFDPVAISDRGWVYGTAIDDSFTYYVAVYKNGTLTVLSPGTATTVNARGTIGGNVFIDQANDITQAALFQGNRVEPVPLQSGDLLSKLHDLNDSSTALVGSYDASYNETDLLYRHGKFTVLDFGPAVTDPLYLHINNAATVSGTTYASGSGRGFRFDPHSGRTTQLNPLPTEPDAWALRINNHGDVLGYSFVTGGIERIGTWDRDARFKTYFVEGTPEVPTISNNLVFNDNNLIVITDVSNPPP